MSHLDFQFHKCDGGSDRFFNQISAELNAVEKTNMKILPEMRTNYASSKPLSVGCNRQSNRRVRRPSVGGMETRWSESELYHSRSLIFSQQNEESRLSSLNEFPSSSHLHFMKSASALSARSHYPHRSNKSVPTISVSNQSLFPPPLPPFIIKQQCQCAYHPKLDRKELVLSVGASDQETPEGLSWKRLHMSRAKLKATATTSELLSGFAMIAMVELQINQHTGVPEWLFVTFAVCTTILISVHIFALMISTYLLPSIDAASKLDVSSLVTDSPHDRMKGFIELAWTFSTILGLLLFLVEVAILCWVKFWDHSFPAAMSATMIVIPVLIILVAFAMYFYHSLDI